MCEVTVHGCHACSLPAADLVAWLTFRRYGFFSSSVALFYGIFGVVELKRGIYTRRPACVRSWTRSARQLSAPRGVRRAVHHRMPRGILCVWPSTTSSSLDCFLSRRGGRVGLVGFPVGLEMLVAARVHVFFEGFCFLGTSKAENFSGLAGAECHSTHSDAK